MSDRSLHEALEQICTRNERLVESHPRIALDVPVAELRRLLADHPEPAGLVVTDQAVAPAARALHEAAIVRGVLLRRHWHQLSVRQKDRYINDARRALEAAMPFLQGSATNTTGTTGGLK